MKMADKLKELSRDKGGRLLSRSEAARRKRLSENFKKLHMEMEVEKEREKALAEKTVLSQVRFKIFTSNVLRNVTGNIYCCKSRKV